MVPGTSSVRVEAAGERRRKNAADRAGLARSLEPSCPSRSAPRSCVRLERTRTLPGNGPSQMAVARPTSGSTSRSSGSRFRAARAADSPPYRSSQGRRRRPRLLDATAFGQWPRSSVNGALGAAARRTSRPATRSPPASDAPEQTCRHSEPLWTHAARNDHDSTRRQS